MTKKSYYEFQERTGKLESEGDYRAVNPYKFLGKYQMGWRALVVRRLGKYAQHQ